MDDFPGNPCGFAGTLCQYFFKSVQKNSFTIYDKKYNIYGDSGDGNPADHTMVKSIQGVLDIADIFMITFPLPGF